MGTAVKLMAAVTGQTTQECTVLKVHLQTQVSRKILNDLLL